MQPASSSPAPATMPAAIRQPLVAARLARALGSNYKWVVWLALCVINFYQNAQMYAAATLVPYLLAELHLSYALAGTLLSAYVLSLAVVITPTGILGDRLGGRRVLIWGVACMLVGSVLFGTANSFEAAFLSRVLTGIGATAAISVTGPVTAFWFNVREFRLVHGIGTGLGKIGSILATWLLAPLMLWLGWRTGYGVLSLLGPVALVATYLFLVSRPQELGLPAVQMGSSSSLESQSAEPTVRLSLWQIIRRPGVLPLAIASLFYFGAYFGSINWLPTYMADVMAMDKMQAGLQTGVILWGTIIGYGITGPAANFLGRCRPLYVSGLALTSLMSVLLATVMPQIPAWALPPLFLLQGVAYSGLLFMTPMLVVLVPRVSLATASGFVFTTSYVGAVLVPPLIGAITDLTGSLAVAFWLPAAGALLGAGAAMFIREGSYPAQVRA